MSDTRQYATLLLSFLAGATLYPATKYLLSQTFSTLFPAVSENGNTAQQQQQIDQLLRDNLSVSTAIHNNNISQHKPFPAILVVGSANADIYVETQTIPKVGETLGGVVSLIGCGGKGSNQAGASQKALHRVKLQEDHNLNTNVQFIGVLGNDSYAQMFLDTYHQIQLDTSHILQLEDTPTGQAYILLDQQANNSIIVCPGANSFFPPSFNLYPQMFDTNGTIIKDQESCDSTSPQSPLNSEKITKKQCILNYIPESLRRTLQTVRCVLLQREIPDTVNLCLSYVTHHINSYYNFEKNQCNCVNYINNTPKENNSLPHILTMMDVGGLGAELELNALNYIHYLTMNETEMGRTLQQSFDILNAKNLSISDDKQQFFTFDNIVDVHSGSVKIHPIITESILDSLGESPQSTDIDLTLDNITVLNDYTPFSTKYTASTFDPSTKTIPLSDLFSKHIDIDHNTELQQIFFGKNKLISLQNIVHVCNAIIAMAGRIPTDELPEGLSLSVKPDGYTTTPVFGDKNELRLLVTLGKYGSIVMGYNSIINYQAPLKLQPHQIVDSTGCGDAYRGAFGAALVETLLTDKSCKTLSGLDQHLVYAMKVATATATLCLSRKGTLPAMPTRAEIDVLLKEFF